MLLENVNKWDIDCYLCKIRRIGKRMIYGYCACGKGFCVNCFTAYHCKYMLSNNTQALVKTIIATNEQTRRSTKKLAHVQHVTNLKLLEKQLFLMLLLLSSLASFNFLFARMLWNPRWASLCSGVFCYWCWCWLRCWSRRGCTLSFIFRRFHKPYIIFILVWIFLMDLWKNTLWYWNPHSATKMSVL